MPTAMIVLLAVVQGITEFAPVSSSAHLALIPMVLSVPDQGLLIDVSAHAGTLAAVMLFLRNDIASILRGFAQLAAGNPRGADGRFASLLLAATVPATLVGALLWALGSETLLRNLELIAWATIGFGLLLYAVDRFRPEADTPVRTIGLRAAFFIGCVQVLAFIPGASRAGVTITAGRLLGLNRETSTRFSFLLAIPTIGAATALGGFEIARSGDAVLWQSAAWVFVLSFLVALAALWGLLRFVRRWSLTPFVVYRVILGVLLLTLVSG